MNARIVADNMALLYRKAAERYGELPAFASRKQQGSREPVSFAELYRRGLEVATGLIELGVDQRDHVGVFGDNRFEWALSDCAVQLCGAANVPKGRDVTDEELVYIITNADTRIVFAETEHLQNRLLNLRDRLPDLREIILLHPNKTPAKGVRSLEEVREIGRLLRNEGDRRAEERMENINPDDLFTLIYTSGTTGRPKGVMLTHANMMSQMEVIPIDLHCADRVLSILPIWHILERVIEVFSISCGTCTYYSGIRTIAEDLQDVEPTFMGSAPRLWENFHKRILDGVRQAHPVRRALFYIAWFLGKHYRASVQRIFDQHLQTRREPLWQKTLLYLPNLLRWLLVVPAYGFFNATVLEQIRLDTTGGSLKGTISGGGALPDEIDHFFNAIGIPVLEGYGLTETSPVLAVRTPDKVVPGTVGPPVPRTEICIVDADTGETIYPNSRYPYEGRGRKGIIYARGPQVMKGYYREPERTEESIQDGWLNTGDLGMMTFNECLKILGRSKSTIVLSNGENLEPEPLEMRMEQSPYVLHCLVVGQDRKHIGALIVPDIDELRNKGALHIRRLDEAADHPEVNHIIKTEINRRILKANDLRPYERIHSFRLLPEPFEIGEELTDLRKMKRHVITSKYDYMINEMFTNDS